MEQNDRSIKGLFREFECNQRLLEIKWVLELVRVYGRRKNRIMKHENCVRLKSGMKWVRYYNLCPKRSIQT